MDRNLSFVRRVTVAVAAFGVVPTLLTGCPKKEEPLPMIPEAAPPVEIDAAPAVLEPMEEDAGPDADADADAPKKATGPAVNANVARLKQCCSALGSQAKALGSSPEAAMLQSASVQCSALAAQAGTGNAPELGALKAMLQGKTIPPICQGL